MGVSLSVLHRLLQMLIENLENTKTQKKLPKIYLQWNPIEERSLGKCQLQIENEKNHNVEDLII